LEDESDPSCGIGNNSVCHACIGTTKELQEKISSGVLKWDKLKAAMEWEERKLSPTSSQQATKQRVDSNKKTKKERDNTIDKSSH
jgi:hypothetical protein